MMKNSIITILFILCSFPVFSQWGVKGGINFSTIPDYSSSKTMISGHIGGSYDFKLSDKWYLQPELQLSSIGFELKDDKEVLKGGHVRIYALELPISFSFRPIIRNDTKLLIDLGLYVRYGLFGNKTYEYYKLETIDESPFDAYNHSDAGLNLGLGLQKNRYYGLFTFQRGFTHAEKDVDSYHQVFKFSLGYKF